MSYEDLPKEIQKHYDNMRHHSSTIQSDVDQALDDAYDLEDFITTVENCMVGIADEARHVANVFTVAFKLHNMKKASRKHRTEYGG